MATEINLTTTGTAGTVTIEDLGRKVFTHPATQDLVEQTTGGGHTFEDIKYSDDLQAAIDGGTIVITDENGNTIANLKEDLSVDVKAKVSATDTKPDYLTNKIDVVLNKLSKSITGSGADETVVFTIGSHVFDKNVNTSDNITVGSTNFFLSSDEKDGLTNASSALTAANYALTLADRGATNGVASLVSGTVPIAQLPTSVTSGMHYKGMWNALTNTPTLADGVGTNGDMYRVSVAGSTSLNGVTDWEIGDVAVYNDTTNVWEKQDNTQDLDSDVIVEGTVNLFYTEARVSANTDVAANTTHRGLITGNPHVVTAGDVGNTVAQWNADEIQGNAVATGVPTDTYLMQWNNTASEWQYVDPAVILASSSKHTFVCGRVGSQNNGYLQNEVGIYMNEGPYLCDRNLTIEAMVLTRDGTGNEWRAEVRLNGALSPTISQVMLAGESEKIGAFSQDVDSGDTIEVYLQKGTAGSGSGANISKPFVRVIMKER